MDRIVQPQTYFLGFTQVNRAGLAEYCKAVGADGFMLMYDAAVASGIAPGAALCSFYAKLCYRSLVPGMNENITKVRDVHDNILATMNEAHGSVFAHCSLNFVVANCSRVFTHEQVRNAVGFNYSQESGRYCSLDRIELTDRSCLTDDVRKLWCEHLQRTEEVIFQSKVKLGLLIKDEVTGSWIVNPRLTKDKKKALTSAVRMLAPEGMTNTLGFTVNIRALRHWLMLRSARFAEEEIRIITGQVYDIVMNSDFSILLSDAKVREVDGHREIYGMRLQPYDMKIEVS